MTAKCKVYWVAGTFAAFAGVYLVRVLSLQATDDWRFEVMLGGHALAILGLFVIMMGTRRKE